MQENSALTSADDSRSEHAQRATAESMSKAEEMTAEVSSGLKSRLEYVLDQVCVEVPAGGSHEMRRFIAEQLMSAAQAGERSLDGLVNVALQALASFQVQTMAARDAV
jgi:hypothetical protein